MELNADSQSVAQAEPENPASPRRLMASRQRNVAQWIVADDVQRVREWLAKVEKRAARGTLKGADLTRLDKVALALTGKSKPSVRTLRARAVRAISDWLATKSTDARPLLAKLAKLDRAFATLQLNRADKDALSGKTGTKPQGALTLAARLSLRAGALGCPRTARPDPAAIESKRRLFRAAVEKATSRVP